MWEKNSKTSEVTSRHRLNLHGIGYELREHVVRHGEVVHSKGSRIAWGIDMMPLAKLLASPLRFNPKVVIVEAAEDSEQISQAIETLRINAPTLGQHLHGVL